MAWAILLSAGQPGAVCAAPSDTRSRGRCAKSRTAIAAAAGALIGHFAAYTAAPSAALTLIADRGLRWYVADGRERGFCAECGASLFWRRAGSEQTSIAAGTLDPPTGLRTALHIFVDSRGDYYEITDGLPQYPGSSE